VSASVSTRASDVRWRAPPFSGRRRAHGVAAVVDGSQHGLRERQECLSCGRKPNRGLLTLEQRHAELVLEQADAATGSAASGSID